MSCKQCSHAAGNFGLIEPEIILMFHFSIITLWEVSLLAVSVMGQLQMTKHVHLTVQLDGAIRCRRDFLWSLLGVTSDRP